MVSSEALFPQMLEQMISASREIRDAEQRQLPADHARGRLVAYKHTFRTMTGMGWDSIDVLLRWAAGRT